MTSTELPAAPAPAPVLRRGLRLKALREHGIVVSLVALMVILAITSEQFLTRTNLENVLAQQAPTLIVAAAGTMVLIAGGFDLSVGAIVAVAGIATAQVANHADPALAVVAGVLCGGVIGAVNGAIVTAGRISSLIGTLATTFIIRGLAVVVTGGLLVSVSNPAFTGLGQGRAAGLPVSVIIMVVVVAVLGFVLSSTSYGRRLYAVGGNAEAARLAGIRVGYVRAGTFVISGLAAGLAGAILASRVATGQPDAAVGLEFTVLAGIVVGGTSIQGGEGAVWRTVTGVLFIAFIDNGFTLLGIDPIYKQIVQGTIILAAVGADAWSRVRT